MDDFRTNTNDLYRDIQKRCNGEIYIGIVGPVRTGKSTFIKRFMDLLVLPNLSDEYAKSRTRDELPQSGGGKTITTTEPKFIPNEAALVRLSEDVELKVRLIDCVGFMVRGATGHMENDKERMVKTPWFEEAIPFSTAARIGTRKVMKEHSTIGIVIVSDGSFTDLSKEDYMDAAQEAIEGLQATGKPFVVVVNSARPYSDTALTMAEEIKSQYGVNAVSLNCAQLNKEDIHILLQEILYAFPVSKIRFHVPEWLEVMDFNHPLKRELCNSIRSMTEGIQTIRDYLQKGMTPVGAYLNACKAEKVSLSDGCISVRLDLDEAVYYELLSGLSGEKMESQRELVAVLKRLGEEKKEYEKVKTALENVRRCGYGVVMPENEEISVLQPEVIKNGNKYGIKITAHCPSIHMIKADIESEISPIVGTQAQAEDLISFIRSEEEKENGIWETNIFGKTVEQLVREGISGKLANIGEESQVKLQETMQKIVNESTGGMVCIII